MLTNNIALRDELNSVTAVPPNMYVVNRDISVLINLSQVFYCNVRKRKLERIPQSLPGYHAALMLYSEEEDPGFRLGNVILLSWF